MKNILNKELQKNKKKQTRRVNKLPKWVSEII